MIWALAGGIAGLICLGGGLLFWALRRALRRGAADTAARLAGMEALLQDIADRPAPLAPDALEDLSTGLKDDLAIMFTYAGRLAAISHEESDRVIACINALHGIEAPIPAPRPAPVAPKAEVAVEDDAPAEDDAPPEVVADAAPGLESMALEELDDDPIAAEDGEPDFDVDNLGTPDWATEDADDAETAEDGEPDFDVDNLGTPDWATEDADDAETAEDGEPEFDVDNLGTPDWATEDADDAETAEDGEPDFDVDNLGTPDWATEDADDAETAEDGEPEFDVDNLGTPDWATEDADDAETAEDGEPDFDVDNLGTPDWATEDADDAETAAEDTTAQDQDLDEDAPAADAPENAAPEIDETPPALRADTPPSGDMSGAGAAMLIAQQEAAERIEARLASLAAGIMALSASTETTERLDAIAASGDTRIAMLTALSQDVASGLAALDAGQTALREALADMGAGGGDADVARIAEALAGLQTRTESLSHAVDAAAGAVDEAAEAAAATVMAAAQDRAAEDEARLQALCDRIAGLAGGQGAPSGDALGALSAQVDGLQARVAEMADLAAIHRDALARVEEAVTPDRLRLALDGAAERSQAAATRRAASRIVDMPALDTPARPPKTAARD